MHPLTWSLEHDLPTLITRRRALVLGGAGLGAGLLGLAGCGSSSSPSGTATGAPLTVKLKLLDVAAGCTPKPGAAVYLWHADAQGRYSLYSQGVTNQNYLRGVQAADTDGWVTFSTVFPGCHDGRWPHIHFEVYESLADASNVRNTITTSQLALPQGRLREGLRRHLALPLERHQPEEAVAQHRHGLP